MANKRRLAELGVATPLASELATQIDAAVAAKAQVAALVSLTDNSGGTASDTIADVPGSYTEATLANQIASMTAKINAIIAALKA